MSRVCITKGHAKVGSSEFNITLTRGEKKNK